MPIAAIDLDGLEQYVVTYYKDQHKNTTQIEVRAVFDINGSVLNQHIHKIDKTKDVTTQNVLVFESQKDKNNKDLLTVVDQRAGLTQQEQDIFNKNKALEGDVGSRQAEAYPDAKNDQYDSKYFVKSQTKSYDANSGILPENEPKENTHTETVKSEIDFKGDEATPEGDISGEINKIVDMVKGKTEYNIVIFGNVNGQPDEDFNTKPGWFHKLIDNPQYKTYGELAINRANAIKAALVKAGLNASKIHTKLGDPHAGMNANYQITTTEKTTTQ
jgi:outer membrane protein OmpA-like peptidoglycan-associated protein